MSSRSNEARGSEDVESAAAKHRIRWFVYAGREKIPHTSKMRGSWGYDAECSCGWKTYTGGATRGSVEKDVWFHKHVDSDGPQLPISFRGRVLERPQDQEGTEQP